MSMLFNNEIREGVVFIFAKHRRGGGWTPFGTAFLVSDVVYGTDARWPLIVTARHVLERASQETDEDQVYIRANAPSGGMYFPIKFSAWIGHPEDDRFDAIGSAPDEWLEPAPRKRFDVAIAYVPKPVDDLRPKYWGIEHFLDDGAIQSEAVGPGDEVAVTGLYANHVGKQRNIPIVRSGIIAAMPEEEIDSALGPMDAYLIETRSIGGLSGSPVFWLSGIKRMDLASRELREPVWYQTKLLGMISGHFDAPADARMWTVAERMNEGIAWVVPSRVILETLRQEGVVGPRKRDEAEMRRKASAATPDSVARPLPSPNPRL